MMGRLTSYKAAIRGDYLTVYYADFPLVEMLSPPQGWEFGRVTEWRKNCPDHCWRILFKRWT